MNSVGKIETSFQILPVCMRKGHPFVLGNKPFLNFKLMTAVKNLE